MSVAAAQSDSLRRAEPNIQTRDFKTFCPKAIAGIGELPGTIADRSIRIELRRRTTDEACERWRERDGRGEARSICDALTGWAIPTVLEVLRDARPDLPTALNDRAADVWEASRITFVDDGQSTVEVSDQADVQMSATPSMSGVSGTGSAVTSLWQTGGVALKVTRLINWRRGDNAVQYVSGANYAASGSPA